MVQFNRNWHRWESSYPGDLGTAVVNRVAAEIRCRYTSEEGFNIEVAQDGRAIVATHSPGGFRIEFKPDVGQTRVEITNDSPWDDRCLALVFVCYLILSVLITVAAKLWWPIPGWWAFMLPSIIAFLLAMSLGVIIGTVSRIKGVWLNEQELWQIGDIVNRVITASDSGTSPLG